MEINKKKKQICNHDMEILINHRKLKEKKKK